MPDTDQPFRIECDASDFATGAVLSQQAKDGKWHPCAYISKSLAPAERNYPIYDKELLAVVRAFEAWRHYLEGATHQVDVWTDHKNLEWFRTSQKLNRRQARWSLYLSRFDYKLTHKAGSTNKSDGLSRRPDHKRGVELDNSGEVLLGPEIFNNPTQPSTRNPLGEATNIRSAHFGVTDPIEPLDPHKIFHLRATGRTAVTLIETDLKNRIIAGNKEDPWLLETLQQVNELGPRSLKKGLQEWNEEDGLVLHRGKVYVPSGRPGNKGTLASNEELRRDIIKRHHDNQAAGHPGVRGTLASVGQDYTWPGMSNMVQQYVEGCTICQSTKNDTHPTMVPLQPTEIPDRPFGTITMDFVTDLPESNGYDSLHVVTDRFTKTAIITPCRKSIDSDETAKLLLDHTWRRYGLPDKIISDRGTQFASKVAQALLKELGIKSSLSTAYHPQTDGATEWMNQELEQYLRAFCSSTQDNWADLIPYAEYAHNSHQHSATKVSPFELLHGYQPRAYPAITGNTNVPTADKRLEMLKKAQDEARASLEIAAESMRIQHDKFGVELPPFKIGDQVWLDGKNIHTDHPSEKLRPKRFGPFKIADTIGTVNYRLELPRNWIKIHNVFHASRLTMYKENTTHGPNYTKPPPDLIEGQEEFEVEKIIKSRRFGRWKTLQYLIKWKGYPESDNSWEPADAVKNAREEISDFHRKYPLAVRGMKPSTRELQLALDRNQILELCDRQIRLLKTSVGKKLLDAGLTIQQAETAIKKEVARRDSLAEERKQIIDLCDRQIRLLKTSVGKKLLDAGLTIDQAETAIKEEVVRRKLLTHPIGKKLLATGATIRQIQTLIEEEHYK